MYCACTQMYSAWRLNKQGDNIQPWCTPFPIWNQSVVPCPVLTVASWPVRRFLKRQVSSVQSLSHVQLFATPWTAAHQASLSITNCWSLSKPMSIELVMPSNHLILCHPLLLLPSIFPSIRVFSNESALRSRWPKYWSFSFNIRPSNEHLGLISFRRQVRLSGIPISFRIFHSLLWFTQSKTLA